MNSPNTSQKTSRQPSPLNRNPDLLVMPPMSSLSPTQYLPSQPSQPSQQGIYLEPKTWPSMNISQNPFSDPHMSQAAPSSIPQHGTYAYKNGQHSTGCPDAPSILHP
jgi:hypothetical protein